MYYVGIDISKYNHDCFICTKTGEVIQENLSFVNTNEGFKELLNLLKSLDNSKQIYKIKITNMININRTTYDKHYINKRLKEVYYEK